MSASVNIPLHHKVQKFSSGTSSPGWSQKKGRKTVVVWWWLFDCVISSVSKDVITTCASRTYANIDIARDDFDVDTLVNSSMPNFTPIGTGWAVGPKKLNFTKFGNVNAPEGHFPSVILTQNFLDLWAVLLLIDVLNWWDSLRGSKITGV